MKTKIIALALFGMTGAAVALFPAINDSIVLNPLQNPLTPTTVNPLSHNQSRVDVVFALDTTGSMSGLIEAAKEKIWSIATTLASAQSSPEIRIGLVAYRDVGDEYITRVIDLSDDLDSMYAQLMDFNAAGGGDGPESVNKALFDAVHKMSWSPDQDTYKVIFLIGDAPPHMDYQNDVQYPEVIAEAKKQGIVINPIQSGHESITTKIWQRMAQLGNGSYLQVEQSGNAVAIATPYDEKLAALSAELDDTRLYYGTKAEKVRQQSKIDASDKLHAESSVASRARRATFNSSASGKSNFLGKGELVDEISSGRVDLDSIEQELLPATMQAMTPVEQKVLISEKAAARQKLKQEIVLAAEQRDAYLKKEVAAKGDVENSLDSKLYRAVRQQAEAKGLHYEEDGLRY